MAILRARPVHRTPYCRVFASKHDSERPDCVHVAVIGKDFAPGKSSMVWKESGFLQDSPSQGFVKTNIHEIALNFFVGRVSRRPKTETVVYPESR